MPQMQGRILKYLFLTTLAYPDLSSAMGKGKVALHEAHLYTFHIGLIKGYRQGTLFAIGSVNGSYIKMQINLTFCALYCGMMR
jgi:hypothetical protein